LLAEQIRQQQLAAALESRLDSQSFTAMQAALLMNKFKSGNTTADTSTLLAAAAALSEASKDEMNVNVQMQGKKSKGRGRTRGRPSSKTKVAADVDITDSQNIRSGDKLTKNTVASLLAKSRELSGGATLTAYELERVENSFSRPELTIEPIFRSTNSDNDQFDSSDSGRRFQSVMEDGKLKIKTISDSPEIRNLSDHEDNNDGYESDELQGNVSSSMGLEQLDDGTANIAITNNIKYNDDSTNSMSCSSQPNSISQATLSIATSTTTNSNNITSMLSTSLLLTLTLPLLVENINIFQNILPFKVFWIKSNLFIINVFLIL
jgi:hypothetical protein